MNKIISIYAEATPNPESMKFVVNQYIAQNKTFDFPDKKAAQNAPFAQKLFDFAFVRQVFISNNFVTILKRTEDEWHELIPILKDFIKSYLESDLPIVNKTEIESNENDNDLTKKIKQILQEYVQPAVQTDGGAISYKSFDQSSGQLTVSLQGACSGCPSSLITLKAGIENLMTRMVPDVKEVVADSI